MNLLVLGATGNTGRQFVDMALERGHRITAIVRSTAGLKERDGLEIIQGDVLNPTVLRDAFSGRDAIVSCLGIRKKTPSDPWSPLLSPEDFTTRSAIAIIDAMKVNGIERLIVISSAGVGDSWETVDHEIRTVIQASSVSKIFVDLNNMEEVLMKSGLDTLAVRPVALANGDAIGGAHIVDRFEKTSKIYTGDVAQWMLDAVERPGPFDQRTEMIGSS
jgi:uncharacterized protein YbjT (DUF2867 family)